MITFTPHVDDVTYEWYNDTILHVKVDIRSVKSRLSLSQARICIQYLPVDDMPILSEHNFRLIGNVDNGDYATVSLEIEDEPQDSLAIQFANFINDWGVDYGLIRSDSQMRSMTLRRSAGAGDFFNGIQYNFETTLFEHIDDDDTGEDIDG